MNLSCWLSCQWASSSSITRAKGTCSYIDDHFFWIRNTIIVWYFMSFLACNGCWSINSMNSCFMHHCSWSIYSNNITYSISEIIYSSSFINCYCWSNSGDFRRKNKIQSNSIEWNKMWISFRSRFYYCFIFSFILYSIDYHDVYLWTNFSVRSVPRFCFRTLKSWKSSCETRIENVNAISTIPETIILRLHRGKYSRSPSLPPVGPIGSGISSVSFLILLIRRLGPNHTERVKTELINEMARNVKTELTHLFDKSEP